MLVTDFIMSLLQFSLLSPTRGEKSFSLIFLQLPGWSLASDIFTISPQTKHLVSPSLLELFAMLSSSKSSEYSEILSFGFFFWLAVGLGFSDGFSEFFDDLSDDFSEFFDFSEFLNDFSEFFDFSLLVSGC